MDREPLLEILQPVEGLTGGQVSLHGAVLFEVFAEDLHVDDESVDVLNQLLLEVGLVIVEVVSDAESFADELIPLLLEVLALVELVTVHLQGVLDKGVHVAHGLELEIDVGLLLADLLESSHDASKRVNVLDLLINLQADLFDVISQVRQKVLGLLVDVPGED